MLLSSTDLIIAAVALVAAAVNGGLGYGFSSITVPVALLFQAGRALNPALVLIELFINALAVFANRSSLRQVLPRCKLLLAGAVPGVALGAIALARIDPANLKLFTFAALLPFILLQSAGVRRPIRRERAAFFPAGVALGALYGATTISGPPLALIFNNQELSKNEFRAALSLFRLLESGCTLVAYLALGLITPPSLLFAGKLAPSALIGLPLGYLALRRLAPEPFRRACMALDALLVGFGLARTLIDRQLLPAPAGWAIFAAVACLEAGIIIVFIVRRVREAAHAPVPLGASR